MLLPGSVVVVVLVTLSETPVPLSLGGETTGLSVLVNGVGDPVDSGITTDGLVLGAAGRREIDSQDQYRSPEPILAVTETHSTRMTS